MKRKDLIRILENAGYHFLRNGGNHDVYSNGTYRIPIPRHSEINEMLAKSIIKKLGL